MNAAALREHLARLDDALDEPASKARSLDSSTRSIQMLRVGKARWRRDAFGVRRLAGAMESGGELPHSKRFALARRAGGATRLECAG
ncbi:MAG: hypothetical protein ACP5MD_06355, partial [Verrucomicrobiia bacterium]